MTKVMKEKTARKEEMVSSCLSVKIKLQQSAHCLTAVKTTVVVVDMIKKVES